jgi:hypothetical protein
MAKDRYTNWNYKRNALNFTIFGFFHYCFLWIWHVKHVCIPAEGLLKLVCPIRLHDGFSRNLILESLLKFVNTVCSKSDKKNFTWKPEFLFCMPLWLAGEFSSHSQRSDFGECKNCFSVLHVLTCFILISVLEYTLQLFLQFHLLNVRWKQYK